MMTHAARPLTIVAIPHLGGQVYVGMLHGRQVRVLFGIF